MVLRGTEPQSLCVCREIGSKALEREREEVDGMNGLLVGHSHKVDVHDERLYCKAGLLARPEREIDGSNL